MIEAPVNAPAQQPDDDVPARPGQILAGKYRVDRVLGRGGMGVVVEARHTALDERVALKFLLPDYAKMPEASARFLREARAAVKIKSEHVARVSDVGELDTGSPYMVMEFLEGTDLSKALERYGVCQIPDAIDYLLQTCEAIAEAHGHGIVHRDLKPANLFLTRRPDGTPMIKVLDFGISKMSGAGVDNLTRTSTSMGSALYMSPEQMQTTRGVDHRTDIYALGISLYELLAGKQPFYADTLPQLCAEVLTGTPTPIKQLRPEVPDGLAAALEKAYARDRDERYQTIAELATGLAPWAPTRSQNTLDRICRMAGVAPTTAGTAARLSNPALSNSQPRLGASGANPGLSSSQPTFPVSGANPGLSSSQPTFPVSGANPALSSSQPAMGAPGANPALSNSQPAMGAPGESTSPATQTGNHPAQGQSPAQPPPGPQAVANYSTPIDALAIGGYHGPMSTKAAAAFAAGASTNTNLSSTGRMPAQSSSKTGLFVVIGVLVLALLGLGAAFLFVRTRAEPAGATAPSGDPTPSAPVTSAPVTTSAIPTADPTASAPATSATATGEPSPSGTSTAGAAPSGTPTSKPKTPLPKSTATGTGTGKKPGVMTSR